MPIGEDSIGGYLFGLEIDGVTLAQFREVSGLSAEIQVIESRAMTADGKMVLKKTPGQRKWGDITLKRGKTDGKELWEWMKGVQEGKVDAARKNASVILYDYEFGEKGRFDFANAWPTKVSLGSMQASGNDVLVEECTFTHEGIIRFS